MNDALAEELRVSKKGMIINMEYKFNLHGTCAKQVNFELNDENLIKNVKFVGGCNGNAKGIAALAENRSSLEVISALEGIKCGYKNTSCPDQFAKALRFAINELIESEAIVTVK